MHLVFFLISSKKEFTKKVRFGCGNYTLIIYYVEFLSRQSFMPTNELYVAMCDAHFFPPANSAHLEFLEIYITM